MRVKSWQLMKSRAQEKNLLFLCTVTGICFFIFFYLLLLFFFIYVSNHLSFFVTLVSQYCQMTRQQTCDIKPPDSCAHRSRGSLTRLHLTLVMLSIRNVRTHNQGFLKINIRSIT